MFSWNIIFSLTTVVVVQESYKINVNDIKRHVWRFIADKNKPKKKKWLTWYLEKYTVKLKICGQINKILLKKKKKWSTIIKNVVLGLNIDEKIWSKQKCCEAEKLTSRK